MIDGADTFVSNHWQVPAAAHNAAVLMEWLRSMDAVEPAGRPAWWQQRCRRAVDRYPVLNAELDHPGFSAFKVPQQLLQWAAEAARTDVPTDGLAKVTMPFTLPHPTSAAPGGPDYPTRWGTAASSKRSKNAPNPCHSAMSRTQELPLFPGHQACGRHAA